MNLGKKNIRDTNLVSIVLQTLREHHEIVGRAFSNVDAFHTCGLFPTTTSTVFFKNFSLEVPCDDLAQLPSFTQGYFEAFTLRIIDLEISAAVAFHLFLSVNLTQNKIRWDGQARLINTYCKRKFMLDGMNLTWLKDNGDGNGMFGFLMYAG